MRNRKDFVTYLVQRIRTRRQAVCPFPGKDSWRDGDARCSSCARETAGANYELGPLQAIDVEERDDKLLTAVNDACADATFHERLSEELGRRSKIADFTAKSVVVTATIGASICFVMARESATALTWWGYLSFFAALVSTASAIVPMLSTASRDQQSSQSVFASIAAEISVLLVQLDAERPGINAETALKRLEELVTRLHDAKSQRRTGILDTKGLRARITQAIEDSIDRRQRKAELKGDGH